MLEQKQEHGAAAGDGTKCLESSKVTVKTCSRTKETQASFLVALSHKGRQESEWLELTPV